MKYLLTLYKHKGIKEEIEFEKKSDALNYAYSEFRKITDVVHKADQLKDLGYFMCIDKKGRQFSVKLEPLGNKEYWFLKEEMEF